MLDERVVLLGGALCQRLEPVCVVCHTVLISPLLHAFSHGISDGTIQCGTVVDHVDKLLIDICRQILVHLGTVENLLAKIL